MPLSSSITLDSERIKIVKKVMDSTASRGVHVKYDIFQRAYFSPFTNASDLGYTKIMDIERKSIMKNMLKSEWWDNKISNSQYETLRLDVDSSLTR